MDVQKKLSTVETTLTVRSNLKTAIDRIDNVENAVSLKSMIEVRLLEIVKKNDFFLFLKDSKQETTREKNHLISIAKLSSSAMDEMKRYKTKQ